MVRVVRNQAYKLYSRNLKQVTLEERNEQAIAFTESFYEPSIEDVVINKDLVQKVKAEINKLKPAEREVINLRIWEEMDFKEISNLTGVKESTLKMRFYRSINKIQNQFPNTIVSTAGIITAIKFVGTGTIFATTTVPQVASATSVIVPVITVILGLSVISGGGVVYEQVSNSENETREEIELRESRTEPIERRFPLQQDESESESNNRDNDSNEESTSMITLSPESNNDQENISSQDQQQFNVGDSGSQQVDTELTEPSISSEDIPESTAEPTPTPVPSPPSTPTPVSSPLPTPTQQGTGKAAMVIFCPTGKPDKMQFSISYNKNTLNDSYQNIIFSVNEGSVNLTNGEFTELVINENSSYTFSFTDSSNQVFSRFQFSDLSNGVEDQFGSVVYNSTFGNMEIELSDSRALFCS